MAVQVMNLVQGPAELWFAPFGSTEPITSVAMAIDPPSPWFSGGGTTDGVNIAIPQEYSKMRVDQVVDNVGARLTSRDFTVETNLAEATLENLSVALNAGAVTTASGVKKLSPVSGSAATQPTYRAMIIDGWAPEEVAGVPLRRRVVVRKVLSTEGAEFAYNLEDQTVFAVTFSGFYVSSSILPFEIYDLDPA